MLSFMSNEELVAEWRRRWAELQSPTEPCSSGDLRDFDFEGISNKNTELMVELVRRLNTDSESGLRRLKAALRDTGCPGVALEKLGSQLSQGDHPLVADLLLRIDNETLVGLMQE